MSLPPLKQKPPSPPNPARLRRARLQDEAGRSRGLVHFERRRKVEIESRRHCSSISVCFTHAGIACCPSCFLLAFLLSSLSLPPEKTHAGACVPCLRGHHCCMRCLPMHCVSSHCSSLPPCSEIMFQQVTLLHAINAYVCMCMYVCQSYSMMFFVSLRNVFSQPTA